MQEDDFNTIETVLKSMFLLLRKLEPKGTLEVQRLLAAAIISLRETKKELL